MIKFKVIHGNSLEILPTIESGSIDLIVTSPPYNCRKPYGGDYLDEMPWPEYYRLMGTILDECYRVLVDGGVIAINVPSVIRWQAEHKFQDSWSDYDPNYPTHRNGKREVGRGRIEPLGFTLFNMMWERDNHMREPIVWVKGSREGEAISTNHQMGSDNNPYMRPCHELILLGSKRQWFHRGGTGMRGRGVVPFREYTKDVWFIPGETDKEHPATFPIEIPRRLIRLFTHVPDSVVLDPFSGLGATGVASAELGREFIGVEQNARYVTLSISRIQEIAAQARMFPDIDSTIRQMPKQTAF